MRPPHPARLPRALIAVLLAAAVIHFLPACGDGGGGDGGQSATIAFTTTDSSGDESATPVPLTLELSAPLSSDTASVDVTVTGGTASAGADFTLRTTTVTIPAGQTQGTVDLDVAQDGFDEPDETVELTLSNPRSGGQAALTLGAARAHTYVLRAQSASATPTISLRAPAPTADEGAGAASIVVQLSRAAAGAVTVSYALAGGTASGADYTLSPGTLTFPAGTLTQTISVPITNDALDEEDETVLVALSAPSGAQLGGPTTATLTIADDDQTPTVSFSASTQSADESDGTVQLGVALSSASGRDVTVSYGTNGGTATGGGVDYSLPGSTLTVPAGQTSATFPISIVEDAAVEGNETVNLALSAPTNATVGNVPGMSLQIVDNDGLPLVGFAAPTSSALENGPVPSVTVTLSAAATQNVQVSYVVSGGSATRGTDYNLSDGVVIFTPGQVSRLIPINVLGDSMDEDDETIVLTLSAPVNASLGSRSVHTFSITDDDVSPVVAFGPAFTVSESAGSASITVSLTGTTARTVTVDYGVTGGTASGADYTLASGTLTFSPGQTSKSVTVGITNDALNESSETIIVGLSGQVNATPGVSSITNTITDDDALPSIAFGVAISSASEATGSPSIPVRLSTVSGRDVTVSCAVVGAGSTATGGGTDYSLTTPITLTIPAGQTQVDVPITVVNDTIDESNETVQLNLTGPGNASLGTTTVHTLTINDDDPQPTIQFQLATSSGAESSTQVFLVVSLSSASAFTVGVSYAVTGGTAATPADFSLGGTALSFIPGITAQNVLVNVVNDSLDENDETLTVTLSSPTNATLGTQTSHTRTIQDEDPLPTVAFTQATSSQLESVTMPAINVSLSAASGRAVTVAFAATGGTATGADYSLGSSPLTIPAGTSTMSLPVTVVNDTAVEPGETINLQISSPTNATLGTQTTHTFTIANND